ncbi:MAG: hypothetical protein ACK56I_03090, partial [bacterium]
RAGRARSHGRQHAAGRLAEAARPDAGPGPGPSRQVAIPARRPGAEEQAVDGVSHGRQHAEP